MRYGFLVSLKVFIPVDPNKPEEVTKGGVAARMLGDPATLAKLVEVGVTDVEASSKFVSRRDAKPATVPGPTPIEQAAAQATADTADRGTFDKVKAATGGRRSA